jgi:hypothetical protein
MLSGLLKLQELFAYYMLQTSQVVHNETVPPLLVLDMTHLQLEVAKAYKHRCSKTDK